MELEKIAKLWEKDREIDETEIGEESRKIPALHDKYYRIYLIEKKQLLKLQHEHKILVRNKHEYFNGKLSKSELDSLGWKPFNMMLVKTEIPIYMESDRDIIQSLTKIDNQQIKLEYLEHNILANINRRGFQIKTILDWMKFSHGEF